MRLIARASPIKTAGQTVSDAAPSATLLSSPLFFAKVELSPLNGLLQKANLCSPIHIDGKQAICLLNGLPSEKGPQDAPRPLKTKAYHSVQRSPFQ